MSNSLIENARTSKFENKNGKSKSCLEMSYSQIENARTSKFENVCFWRHCIVYKYIL